MKTNELNINSVKDLYCDKEFNIEETANKLGISFWSLYNFMNKNNISRRSPSRANFIVNKTKPQFKIKDNLTIWEEKLKIAGIMLYWAEGTLKGNTVDFVNSNPLMIKVFLEFLRIICGINEVRLRVYLYTYSERELHKNKKYWSKVTNVSLDQFTKPYVRRGNLNLSKSKLPYGLVHIRYNDKRLLALISNWIEEYCRAGTQVAKGDRLCKRSVMSKGMMEK